MIGCVLVLFPTLFLAAASSLTKPISYDFQGEFALRYEAHVSSNKSVRVESLGDWNIFKVRLEFDDCPIQNTSDPSVTFCYRTITENMYEGLRTPKEDLTNATALSCEQNFSITEEKLSFRQMETTEDVHLTFAFSKENKKRSMEFTLNFLENHIQLKGQKRQLIVPVLRRRENGREVFDFMLTKGDEFADCKVEMQTINVDPFGIPEKNDNILQYIDDINLDQMKIAERVDAVLENINGKLTINKTIDIKEYIDLGAKAILSATATIVFMMACSVSAACIFACLYCYCPRTMTTYRKGRTREKVFYKVVEVKKEVPTMEQPTKELPTKPVKTTKEEEAQPLLKKNSAPTVTEGTKLEPKQKAAKKKAAKNVPKVVSESMMSSVDASPKSTIGKTEMECSQSPFDTGKSKIGTVKTNSQAPGSTECTTEGRTQTFKRIYKDAEKSGAQERVEGVNSESSMQEFTFNSTYSKLDMSQPSQEKSIVTSVIPSKQITTGSKEAQPSSTLTMPSKTGSYDSSAMHD